MHNVPRPDIFSPPSPPKVTDRWKQQWRFSIRHYYSLDSRQLASIMKISVLKNKTKNLVLYVLNVFALQESIDTHDSYMLQSRKLNLYTHQSTTATKAYDSRDRGKINYQAIVVLVANFQACSDEDIPMQDNVRFWVLLRLLGWWFIKLVETLEYNKFYKAAVKKNSQKKNQMEDPMVAHKMGGDRKANVPEQRGIMRKPNLNIAIVV
ncbi:hypothetical protein BCR42DRAFT_390492 [Absidia repens]|uniref:Uncharacterized protein n=1 Tax=Absidia repens TaxID=90262 RepID=A0A1X2IPD1_9FUNG|nr:hypothetical protein BCR42DRAFT_390492 [Absidia repens]